MRKPVVPDRAQQQPTAAGQVATEAVPSAFCVEPTGNFVFASGRLASYRINSATDALTRRPCGGSQVRS